MRALGLWLWPALVATLGAAYVGVWSTRRQIPSTARVVDDDGPPCRPAPDWLDLERARRQVADGVDGTYVVFGCAAWDMGSTLYRRQLNRAEPFLRANGDAFFVAFVDIDGRLPAPDPVLLPALANQHSDTLRVCAVQGGAGSCAWIQHDEENALLTALTALP